MGANSIGSFNFVRLSSVDDPKADGVQTVYQRTELIQRPGVDGTGLVQLGLKGDPFQLASFVDVDTFTNAQLLAVAYRALVGGNPQVVCVAGLNYYSSYLVGTVRLGHKFLVTKVTPKARATGASVGGLTNGGLGVVEAVWELVPIYTGYSG